MTRRILFLLALSLPIFSQTPLTIAAGSPTDQYFNGGVGAWAMPLSAPNSFLRYGTNFSYDIPLSNGFYNIILTMAEPNKTAVGQRVFTVTANGQTSSPIDLFGLTHTDNAVYGFNMQALVGAGWLHLQFVASKGNAVVSSILITPVSYVLTCACNPTP